VRPTRGWHLGTLGILVVVGVLAGAGFRLTSKSRIAPPPATAIVNGAVPAIYALPPTSARELRHPRSVSRAVGFLTELQPEETYVLSIKGTPTVVPMDVAHAAIAFVSVDRLQLAESAMTWLYQRMIRPDSAGAVDAAGNDFSGSWYDALQPNGDPTPGASRGRGEAVGMALIATYSIYEQDPAYVSTPIGDSRIIDLVELATQYLARPSMQAPDGRFYHSPTYRVSFNEECARMTLGLQLAVKMLRAQGDLSAAERASAAASRGLQSLRDGRDLSQGMAYDFYGRAIWGLATPAEAKKETSALRSAGLVEPGGVRNWDWQLSTASSPLVWLRWWAQAQTIAPSQTFDYAIASVGAGDLTTALKLEKLWLSLQRPDGGFDDGFLFGPLGLHLGFGQPTSYAVARFILLENLLTHVVGSTS
jgi:hypothetical protein